MPVQLTCSCVLLCKEQEASCIIPPLFVYSSQVQHRYVQSGEEFTFPIWLVEPMLCRYKENQHLHWTRRQPGSKPDMAASSTSVSVQIDDQWCLSSCFHLCAEGKQALLKTILDLWHVGLCSVTAEELWKGVLAETGAGARKGRGKRAKRKLRRDLNRGQHIGEGESSHNCQSRSWCPWFC